ncbi:sugar ABC transporter substrate-binding protein [Nocardioides bruguierae]|uniref:Substrate-binding domain-containing protein n=1 Tax=Nocardioides bruguierae TaxID=2945102 RepID=A0A9X2IHM9_9ACTN|nr:substrate-binding domain-containing protein [Nocardioides bruguierae]MCL8027669.1 substrate-binding domain-containing protein [Nocardioides bruguierae]MCM0621970.1 substrate-binding domain-containing protein [Nocardioides bruguierae]
MKPRRTTIALAAAATALALSMTACTSATEASDDSSSASTADLTDAQQSCVDSVQPKVEAASAEVDLLAPDSPIDLDAVSGETIWFITVTMNQFSSDMLAGVEEAADAAGVSVKSYDGQGSTNRYNEGIEQAIAQGAAGIILVGIDPSVVSSALADADAAGIPVQNTLNSDPDDELAEGLYGNLTSDFSADGATMADWALADSGCDATISIIYSSAIKVWDLMATAAEAEIKAECSDCNVDMLDIDLANAATDVGAQLQSSLQKNPDTNYVIPVWDSAVTYVTPVIAAAGSDAKVISRDGLEANIAWVLDGTQDVTVGTPPTDWLGWLSVDDLLRAMTGEDAPGYVIPTRIIDSETVGDGSTEDIWPAYVDFQSAFTEAWNG